MRTIIAPDAVTLAEAPPAPTFSVIVPAYQAAATIGEAIDSVLGQTRAPHEIVVCDDGSTDDLDRALEPYRAHVSVIRQENQGEGAAKNTAARAASSEYVVLLDADDAFMPERLEALGELAAHRPDLDILTTDAFLESDGTVLRRAYTDDWQFETEDQQRGILERNFVFGAAAVRLAALTKAGGFDTTLRHAADWDLWIRMIHAGSRAGLIAEPLYRYRISPSALSADRLRLTRGFVAVLEKASSLDLSDDERRALETTIERHRREVHALELREALGTSSAQTRRRAVAVTRDGGQPLARRIRAGGAVLAPRVAMRLQRRRGRGGFVGAGGTQVRTVKLVAYTDAGELGGAEISLGHLLSALPATYQVTVCGVNRDVVAAVASRREGVTSCVLPPVRRKEELGRVFEHVRVIRRLRPDIVHVSLNTPWSAQYGTLAGLLTPRARVVLVEQALFRPSNRSRPAFKRLAALRVAAHVAPGERSAREIERMCGLARGSVHVIYNGVPDVDFRSHQRPVPGPIVGAVGRLDEQKGFDLLVEALPSWPGATVLLVGDGPDRGRLEELARRLGVSDRLLITGWSEEARSYLPTFDVFVLPSYLESFPLSIVEAMLAERAIVATDVGSVREALLDGETGLLVRPGDSVALAAAVRRLLEDPELRSSLARGARSRALELFSARRMAAEFDALYREVLR